MRVDEFLRRSCSGLTLLLFGVKKDTTQENKKIGDVVEGACSVARIFEVFLIVLDGVQGETLWGGMIPRAQPHS